MDHVAPGATTPTEGELAFNGVDGETGAYAHGGLSLQRLADHVRRERGPADAPAPSEPVRADADVADLGWGVVFPADACPDIRRALGPLLERRVKQAGALYKVLEHRPGETFRQWLKRHELSPGNRDRRRVPGFLMLVGPPESIPFDLQYLLDIDYAVGRLDLGAAADYAAYADSVLAYETTDAGALKGSKEIVYWGPRHDRATELCSDHLLQPLADGEGGGEPAAEASGFRTTKLFESGRDGVPGEKRALLEVMLRSAGPPGMIFTASHGVSWRRGHGRQAAEQGALLGQSWSPGEPPTPEDYLAASDLEGASIHGAVLLAFACFSAGTPKLNGFDVDGPATLADASFTAALPRRLLAHPRGALAVIGHVDRAWSYSFAPRGVGSQVGPFRKCIGAVLEGRPVGLAMADFGMRFSILSAEIGSATDPRAAPDARLPDDELVWSWVERNDARSYVLLGDPAVGLRPELLV